MSLTDDYKQNVADMHLQQKKNILHIWQIIVSVMPDSVPGFFFLFHWINFGRSRDK